MPSIREQVDPDRAGYAVIEKAEQEKRREDQNKENGQRNKPERGTENDEHFNDGHAVAHIHRSQKVAGLFVELIIADFTMFMHLRHSEQKNIAFGSEDLTLFTPRTFARQHGFKTGHTVFFTKVS